MAGACAAIGVICKAPRAGSSKTRLIPGVGADKAAELSRCFLRDVASAIEAVPVETGRQGHLIFAPADGEAELRTFMPASFGAMCQHHQGFGAVLFHAAKDLLAQGHDCVLLVNGDSPTLPPSLLDEAIAHLRLPGERVVFGPAADGGYYLIGLKTVHAHLFENISWSTPHVLAQSLERAAAINLPVVTLAQWYDVDDAQSLDWLKDELGGNRPAFLDRPGNRAEATRAALMMPQADEDARR